MSLDGAAAALFGFDNSYARELDEGFYQRCAATPAPQPRLLFFNPELGMELGLDPAAVQAMGDEAAAAVFAGNRMPAGAEPLAQAYAGHQFGGFSAQLGDGRALLMGEVIDRRGRRRDIAFKGSGRTAFSRGGDGKAAVGPMLREVLIGEALHALGIPSTRALAVVSTGERVYRDRPLPGAVLTRVAASHLRVGTFQYFAARRDHDRLRRLLDYAIARHDPDLAQAPEADRALAFLRAVSQRQASLLAQWMNVGFIHGVMNTDNMTISGESIDFGPCAFMEAFDPAAVFSSIDHGGRYAFGNQPLIAHWNLARLAESLLPFIDTEPEAAVARATAVLEEFVPAFAAALRRGQRAKLGLRAVASPPAGGAASRDPLADADDALAGDWLDLLQQQRVDFTLAWRYLSDAAAGAPARLQSLFSEPADLKPWLERWGARLALDDGLAPAAQRLQAAADMRRASPWLIPRNHRVEGALAAASDEGDLEPFLSLLQALRQPFDERPQDARYAEPAPPDVTAAYQTFCGT